MADISNYSGPLLTANALALRAAGVRHVIVRLGWESEALSAMSHQQLDALRAVGIPVSGYVFPKYEAYPVPFITDLAASAGPLASLWIDVEPPNLPDFQTIYDWIRPARSAYRVGIYTAKWVVEQFPEWQGLEDIPLWAADYRPFTGLAVDFGGWRRAAGIQYAGSVQLGGVLCDLSYFDPAALG